MSLRTVMIASARPENAPVTSSPRSQQRRRRLKESSQALARSTCQRCPAWTGALAAFTGDFPGHAAAGELVAGLLRVPARAGMDGDVAGQRPGAAGLVQRGGQERAAVPVRGGEHAAGRDAFPPAMRDHFMPGLPRPPGPPAHSPPPGALAAHPPTARSSRTRPAIRSQDSPAIVSSRAKIPAPVRSPRRSRIVAAPQAQPAIGA
jgi:hypothetical protein